MSKATPHDSGVTSFASSPELSEGDTSAADTFTSHARAQWHSDEGETSAATCNPADGSDQSILDTKNVTPTGSSRNMLRAAAETMVIQAEELAREALMSKLNEAISEAIQPLNARLKLLEAAAKVAPHAAGQSVEARVNELVEERCQTCVNDLEAKLVRIDFETQVRIRELDDKTVKLTHDLNKARVKWKHESQQLWEAVDSHTHDVNVHDEDDLQTLPAAVFRGQRPEYDPTDATDGVEDSKNEECGSVCSAITGSVSVITPSVLGASVAVAALDSQPQTRIHSESPTRQQSGQSFASIPGKHLGILPESPLLASESPMMQTHCVQPRGMSPPLTQNGGTQSNTTLVPSCAQGSASTNATLGDYLEMVPTAQWMTVPGFRDNMVIGAMANGLTGVSLLSPSSTDPGQLSRRGSLPVQPLMNSPSGGSMQLKLPSLKSSPAGSLQLPQPGASQKLSPFASPLPVGSLSPQYSSMDLLGSMRAALTTAKAENAAVRSRSSPPAVFRDLSAMVQETLSSIADQLTPTHTSWKPGTSPTGSPPTGSAAGQPYTPRVHNSSAERSRWSSLPTANALRVACASPPSGRGPKMSGSVQLFPARFYSRSPVRSPGPPADSRRLRVDAASPNSSRARDLSPQVTNGIEDVHHSSPIKGSSKRGMSPLFDAQLPATSPATAPAAMQAWTTRSSLEAAAANSMPPPQSSPVLQAPAVHVVPNRPGSRQASLKVPPGSTSLSASLPAASPRQVHAPKGYLSGSLTGSLSVAPPRASGPQASSPGPDLLIRSSPSVMTRDFVDSTGPLMESMKHPPSSNVLQATAAPSRRVVAPQGSGSPKANLMRTADTPTRIVRDVPQGGSMQAEVGAPPPRVVQSPGTGAASLVGGRRSLGSQVNIVYSKRTTPELVII